MDTFQTLEQLNQLFTNKQLDTLPQTFTLNGVEFQARETLFPPNVISMNAEGRKIIALFNPKARSNENRVAFVWVMKKGLVISPLLVKLIGTYRGGNEEAVMKEATEKTEEPTIGGHIDIVLSGFNNDEPITGKVDTGATINSLHADTIEVRKDPLNPDSQVVDFVYGGKKYTVGLEQQQSVQSADGGVNYRPVVSFTVKYDGKVFKDVLFNLNDRGDMEDKLLIGMNLLSEIGYKIDPTEESEEISEDNLITEEEWKWIEQQIEKDVISLNETNEPNSQDDLHMLYEFLLRQNITFSDLLKHVKVHTIYTVEHLES